MSNTRATVTINTPADRDQIARWAQKVEVGTIVEFRKKTRSHEQNAKLHAMLGEVAEQVEWYGTKLDAADWKTVFTASLRKAHVIPGIDAGTVVPLGLSTSTMTIEEMSNLIELIAAFGAQHHVVFREPVETHNTESGSSSKPDADDLLPSGTSAKDGGVSSPPASPSSHSEWLFNVAKMLWAATHFNGDVVVLKAQKVAAMESYPKPEDCPAVITGKAEAVYGYCRQIVEGSLEPDDGLALVAGVVGCDQADLKGGA